jgi:hypothetical protein
VRDWLREFSYLVENKGSAVLALRDFAATCDKVT